MGPKARRLAAEINAGWLNFGHAHAALVSSRPETAKVDRKTQNRKKVSLLFRALTRELIPAAVFLEAHS